MYGKASYDDGEASSSRPVDLDLDFENEMDLAIERAGANPFASNLDEPADSLHSWSLVRGLDEVVQDDDSELPLFDPPPLEVAPEGDRSFCNCLCASSL